MLSICLKGYSFLFGSTVSEIDFTQRTMILQHQLRLHGELNLILDDHIFLSLIYITVLI